MLDLHWQRDPAAGRWIPPGRFLMGSPEDEEGRVADEGPRHEERIGTGFWLFDTPCTQALWETVMEANPSQFKGPDRPVECVSWDECHEFVRRLNDRFPGLELGLPSEAQWEYACRAGTATVRYHAKLEEIAWYCENSGGETHRGGWKAAERVGPVRHAGERVGVVQRCLAEGRLGSPRGGTGRGSVCPPCRPGWLRAASMRGTRAAFRFH